jgi:hypothetical protein
MMMLMVVFLAERAHATAVYFRLDCQVPVNSRLHQLLLFRLRIALTVSRNPIFRTAF